MVGLLAQGIGLLLITIGAALIWSPWALIIMGVMWVIIPELFSGKRRREVTK